MAEHSREHLAAVILAGFMGKECSMQFVAHDKENLVVTCVNLADLVIAICKETEGTEVNRG